MTVPVAPVPRGLLAVGAAAAPFIRLAAVADLPEGALRRATVGDLDVLLIHGPDGLLAIDDRCPHMAAPLSLGRLEGCILACPLHSGRFDLSTGDVERMPTTGGLDADGAYHPTWSPPGRDPKPDQPGIKAEARALTRVRRLRYYPVRVTADGGVEVAVPVAGAPDLAAGA